MAPATGLLSIHERSVVLEAIALGMNVVNGLHEFLNDDAGLRRRQPPPAASRSSTCAARGTRRTCACSAAASPTVTCPRIAVLGTDSAIGKRTTATILTQALNDRGHQGGAWSAPARPA